MPPLFGTQRLRELFKRGRLLLGPPLAHINEYEEKIRSQNGEDGILRALFRSIGTTSKYAVEFGVGDGRECNTAHLVTDCGWSGLMIEGDPALFARLVSTFRDQPQVRTLNEFVSAETIARIFQTHGVPQTFDLLSIDVDGNDYWIWRALDAYRPRVVVIEYNAAYPPPAKWVMQYNSEHRWDGTTYYGASLRSLSDLASGKGYALVGTDSAGVNAFFVRRDALRGRRAFAAVAPAKAFHPPAFLNQWGGRGHPPGEGPSCQI